MDNPVFDYFLFIKKRFKWLIIIPVLCGLLGILYASLQDHKYEADLTFVSNNDNNSSPYSFLMQQVGIDMNDANNAFEGDNLVEFLKTRSLVEQTLLTPITINNKRQLLVDYYADVYKLREKWNASDAGLKSIQFYPDRQKYTLLQDSALKLIYQDVSSDLSVSKPDKKLSIVSISYISKDASLAKCMVETLVDNATTLYIKSKISRLQENVNILQYKVDSINGRVSGNLSDIATTQDINVNPVRKTSQIPIQRQQINLQVNNAVLAELIKNLELAKVQLNKQTPFIQVLDRPILPLDDKKSGRLLSGIIGGFIGGFLTIVWLVGQIQFIKLKKNLLSQSRMSAQAQSV